MSQRINVGHGGKSVLQVQPCVGEAKNIPRNQRGHNIGTIGKGPTLSDELLRSPFNCWILAQATLRRFTRCITNYQSRHLGRRHQIWAVRRHQSRFLPLVHRVGMPTFYFLVVGGVIMEDRTVLAFYFFI